MDGARLRATFEGEGWQRPLQRLRARLEYDATWRGVITLSDATPAEHAAMRRLFGSSTRRQNAHLRIDATKLEDLLRHVGLCASLSEAIESLTGPLRVRIGLAQQQQTWRTLLETAFIGAPPWAAPWLERMQRTGLVRRLADSDQTLAQLLVRQVVSVAQALPGRDIPLPELAAATLGDSHALDRGQPLGTLCLHLASIYNGQPAVDERPWREIWAAVGIITDELSAPLLVLNLSADGTQLTDRLLQMHAEFGEPCRISVRQLLRFPPTLRRMSRVFVCENPTITLAAANALGVTSAPLICTDGQPKTAARLLLNALSQLGVPLFYHGDFDWPGVRIANLLRRRHGVQPWRMQAQDYLDGCGQGRDLAGQPTQALWDPELAPAMQREGKSVHEEVALTTLLQDLRQTNA